MSESEYRFVNVESFDDGTIVRIMLEPRRRATRRTAACSSSSTTRSCGPRPTTPCGS